MMRHIVAFGGGMIFDPVIIQYCCNLVPKSKLLDTKTSEERKIKLCYLPTASGDQKMRIDCFYNELSILNNCHIELSHIQLVDRTTQVSDKINNEEVIEWDAKKAKEELANRLAKSNKFLEEKLIEQDVIFVGGGNTVNMLMIWREHGVYNILKKCYQKGIILCGTSAGALCWFEGGITDSYGPLLPLYDGLGLLPYRCCPHFLNPARKIISKLTLLSELEGPKKSQMVAIDDGAAVHFVDEQILTVVSSRPGSSGYMVSLEGDGHEFKVSHAAANKLLPAVNRF